LVMGRRRKKAGNKHTQYTIEVGNTYLEPDAPSRFINHSSRPNSRFQKWSSGDDDKEHVAVVSNRRIKANEEITVEYSPHHSFD
jgi:SET domain-containing protein